MSDSDNTFDSDITEDFVDGGVFESSFLEFIALPRTLRALGPRTFYACGCLKTITLPEALEVIGECCFAFSWLQELELPASVSEVSSYAFWGCAGLKSVRCAPGSALRVLGERAFYQSGLQ